MQSYYIMNTNGQSYCVYLEYRDKKNIVQLEMSHTQEILAKDNAITERNIDNNCW